MSRLMALFYDGVMGFAERACLGDWRRELLDGASGRILDIGAGTGIILKHLPEHADLEVFLAEPDPDMRQVLAKRLSLRPQLKARILDAASSRIPLGDSSMDFVMVSLVLCTVPDARRTLCEIRRVLKPDGWLLFLEHVGGRMGTNYRTLQDVVTPVWRRLAGNCHLNRDTETAIQEAGFRILSIRRASMARGLPLITPCIRGVAIPL